MTMKKKTTKARKRKDKIAKTLVYIDDLTGMYNRRYLKKIKKHITQLITTKIPVSIAVIDIDRFKEINDTYGHQKGDEIIIEFAGFLKDMLRASDKIVRYGGDEFVCIMPYNRRRSAEKIYWRMLDRIKKRKFIGVDITISAGIASYPDDGASFEKLFKVADDSLYDAKRSGRGRIGLVRKKILQIPTQVFIDRRNEKDSLRVFLTMSKKGVRVVTLKGNVGIGKTRIAREVLSDMKGKEVLWSDCISLYNEMSYYPIRELIKYKVVRRGEQIFENLPPAYLIEIDKLIPGLITKKIKDADSIGLVTDRYRLYESIKTLLSIGEKEKVIVIDNMQWVDEDTTEVLKYLLRALKEQPLIFILIYRQEEKSPIIQDFNTYISREIAVSEIELKIFEPTDVRELLRAIIGETPNKELFDYVTEESGGNPFYAEEIVKLLYETGHLKVIDDAWVFEKPDAQVIPKRIEDITDRKYNSMSKEEKEVLDIASASGKFDLNLIQHITGYNEGHIAGIVEHLIKIGFVKTRGEKLEFQEAISRDVIYKKSISGLKGRLLHKKIADTARDISGGKDDDILEELAYHYYLGWDKEHGVSYAMQAGDRAKEQYANESALRYYSWADELLADQKKTRSVALRIDCLLKRSKVLSLIGKTDDAMKDLDLALSKTLDIKDRKREADVRSDRVKVLFNFSKYDEAIKEATTALDLYTTLDDKKGVAAAIVTIGNSYCHLGKYKKAEDSYINAQKIAKETGDIWTEAHAYGGMSVVYSDEGDLEKSITYSQKALDLFRSAKDVNLEIRTLNNLGITYMRQGEYEEALKIYVDALERNKTIGSKSLEGAFLHNIGQIQMLCGSHEQALKNFQDSADIFRMTGSKYSSAIATDNVGNVYKNLGEYQKALDNFTRALVICTGLKDKSGEARELANIGAVYDVLGQHEKALNFYDRAKKKAEEVKSREKIFYISLEMADLYMTMQKMAKAKDLYDEIIEIARESKSKSMLAQVLTSLCTYWLETKNIEEFNKNVGMLKNLCSKIKSKKLDASLNVLLGRFNIMRQDFEQAEKDLNCALEIYESTDEQLQIAIVHYYLGELRSTMKQEHLKDRDFGRAQKIFNKLGARWWSKKTSKKRDRRIKQLKQKK